MRTPRALSALLFSACFVAVNLPVTPVAQAYAQAVESVSAQGDRVLLDAVREAVRQNPALADGVGDRALLAGVRRAVRAQPQLTDSIQASARNIRPHLAYEIQQAAQTPPVYAQAAPITPQAVPSVPPQTVKPAAPASSVQVAGKSLIGGLGDHALIGLAAAAAASVGVAAATGGGGGDKEPAPPPSTTTQEYNNQWGLGAIKASSAYSRGATGDGVLVAVADTGVLETHTDLDDNVNPNGHDFADDDTDPDDPDGHGTHVAGIIGAERDGNPGALNMHGVAYDAEILPIRIIGPIGAFANDIVDGVNHARTEGAQVYNGSYGPDYSDPADTIQTIDIGDAFVASAYQDAADDGMVLVFAAGNDYDTNPGVAENPAGGGIYPYIQPANAGSGVYDDGGANYNFSGLEGMLIAVVATGENGSIASYSNRCGVAEDWCIAAPGSNIFSTNNDGSYVEKSGTSMATPHVSGAVAVLMDMFPSLTPEEIVERLFLAANKNGIYADGSIYGQGFLDLEKATRPIGALSVMMGASVHSGASFDLKASSMSLGSAFGDGLKVALVGQKLAVFDQQKATFMVDLGDFAQTADSRVDLDGALRRFRSRFGAQTIRLGGGASLSYTMVDLGQHDSATQDPALGNRDASMEMAYSQTIGDMRWKMNYNINPSTMFGIYESGGIDSNAMVSRDAFAAPYLSFAKQGYSMGSSVPLSESFSMNVATFTGYPLADEMRSPEERAESFGHMAELVYKAGPLKLFTQAGMLTEKETFLGSRTEGAFDLESGTNTSFAGVNGDYRMTERWRLVGSYYHGISSPQLDSHSLFDDISDVRSESFSLGMLGSDVFREGDGFGILGNQPLRVTGGDATLSLAMGRSTGGMLYMQDYDVNLAPTGRELNLEAFYHFSLPDTRTQLMSSMMYRSEPGHVENAADEGLFLLQLQQPF